MKPRPLLILLFLLVVGCVGVGWLAWDQTSPPVVPLSDGSWLELHGVTVGTNATFHYGPIWQRMAARVPGKFGQKYRGNFTVSTYASTATSITFWFVRRGAPLQTNNVTPARINSVGQIIQTGQLLKPGVFTPVVSAVPIDGLKVNLRDEDGHGEPGFHMFRRANLAHNEEAFYWAVQAVPTQSPRIKLCVYKFPGGPSVLFGGSGGKRIGEILLPNPLYRKEP
jgi:hypothetical protein